MSPGNVDNGIRSLMALVRNTFVSGWEGLFAGTTSGIPVSNGSGTISAKAAPTGDIVGTTDTQTLTNKTIGSLAAALTVAYGGTGQGTAPFAVTGSASSGTLTFSLGGSTVFKLTWKDVTAAADSITAVTYHSSYSSWSRAIFSGGAQNFAAEDNDPFAYSPSTTGCSVFNAGGGIVSGTVIAIGV